MLQQLSIQNYALIESLRIEPEEGLNLLTGETGAGKTIVTGALAVLTGGRATVDMIRKGEEEAFVEGFFDVEDPGKAVLLESWGIEDPAEGLLLRREIARRGKNRCLINGRMVPLNVYRDVGALLIDIHGQNQEQSLLRADRQLALLDRTAGPELTTLRREVASLWKERSEAAQMLEALNSHVAEDAREADFLTYQLKEIEAADLTPDEKEELERERNKLANLETLFRGTRQMVDWLTESGGVLENLGAAMEESGRLEVFDSALDEPGDVLRDAYYNLEETARDIRSYHESLDFETGRLNEIETRLADIHFLEKKYGGSVEAVLAFAEKAREQLSLIENRDEEITRWTGIHKEKVRLYGQKAEALTALRRQAAERLGEQMTGVVRRLSLPHARLEIAVTEGAPGPGGIDRVAFMFSPNPGEGLAPLARIASGGEVSRVMLGVKVILADADDIGILVFDEVDTGIGGEAIVSVAENLSRLARGKQVFCVSHAPQLAAFGDCHFRIEKRYDGSRTRTGIAKLDEAGRIGEIARMLGGEGNIEGVQDQARKMLQSARNRRNGPPEQPG